jgi:hypothetical protein
MTEEEQPPARPREEREALAGEIIGATLVIEWAPGLAPLPLRGKIIDESLGTFLVEIPGHERPRRIPKGRLDGTILLGSRELPLNGDSLRVRPEDRTKRLLLGGPKRFR